MSSAKNIAIGLIWREGQLLVGRRATESVLGGYDEFPGGKCEPGETPEQAVIRECLEEAGLATRVLTLRECVEHQYEHGLIRLHFFDCEPIDSCAELCAPFHWRGVEEVLRMNFPPANASILDSIRETPRPKTHA